MCKELEALDTLDAIGTILLAMGSAGNNIDGLAGLGEALEYLGRMVSNATDAVRDTVESNN